MAFGTAKNQQEKKNLLSTNVDHIINSYRPEIVSKIREFHDLDNYRSRRYIRTSLLVLEIERGKVLIKLMKLWMSGVVGIFLRLFRRDMNLDKLDEQDRKKIFLDTRQNYTKSTIKQINREIAAAFAKAGYNYEYIQMSDLIEPPIRRKRYPRSFQTKFWWAISKFFSVGKLPALLSVFLSTLSLAMSRLVLLITQIINNEWYINVSIALTVHFIAGVANAAYVFNDWLDEIAEQIEAYSEEKEMIVEQLADEWIVFIKKQVEMQILTPIPPYVGRAATLFKVLLVGAFVLFMVMPLAKGAFSTILTNTKGVPNIKSDVSADETIVLQKEKVLNVLREKGNITILAIGKDFVLERTIPKKFLWETIPTSDLEIKVTYDYSANFVFNLGNIVESNIEIYQDRYTVYIPMPGINDINISNDRKELRGGLFGNNGNAEEEIEAFDPGNDSYIDILKKDAETKLMDDQELRNKAIIEAQEQVRDMIIMSVENTKEVQVFASSTLNPPIVDSTKNN